MDFGGTPSFVSYNISPYNGTWIHLAGVWDRNGIGNTDCIIAEQGPAGLRCVRWGDIELR